MKHILLNVPSQWDGLKSSGRSRGFCGFADELISVASLAPSLEISEKADFSFSMSESRPSARDFICVSSTVRHRYHFRISLVKHAPREWYLMRQLIRGGGCTRVIAVHLIV